MIFTVVGHLAWPKWWIKYPPASCGIRCWLPNWFVPWNWRPLSSFTIEERYLDNGKLWYLWVTRIQQGPQKVENKCSKMTNLFKGNSVTNCIKQLSTSCISNWRSTAWSYRWSSNRVWLPIIILYGYYIIWILYYIIRYYIIRSPNMCPMVRQKISQIIVVGYTRGCYLNINLSNLPLVECLKVVA